MSGAIPARATIMRSFLERSLMFATDHPIKKWVTGLIFPSIVFYGTVFRIVPADHHPKALAQTSFQRES